MNDYFAPDRWAQYCCQHVCMYVCLLTSQNPHFHISPHFLHATCSLDLVLSDGNAIRYVLLVLWMTSCFHIMVRKARIKDNVYDLSSSTPGELDETYHQGQSLPSPSASCQILVLLFQHFVQFEGAYLLTVLMI